MTPRVTRWRFTVPGRGLGVEVLAGSPALAWAKLRATPELEAVPVLGGPVAVETVAVQGVRLAQVLGVERAA